MAILEALPGIEVTIESQGRPLPEYRDGKEEWAHDGNFDIAVDKRSSNYVECVSDAEFRVALSMKPPRFNLNCECLTFCVRIDGQAVGDMTCSIFNRASSTAYVATSRERLNANEVTRRPFKFATIRRIDDADSYRVEYDAKSLPGVGEIMVSVYRSYEQPTLAWNPTPKLLENAPNEIAEKALKGHTLSHGVAYGDERRERSIKKKKRVLIDGRRKPIAVFSFKYRSREALQQELIIPRSPSPDIVIGPLNLRSEKAPLSKEEQLAKLKREIDLVKSEFREEDLRNSLSQGKKRAAKEINGGRAYKTTRNSNGFVVVDLTDD